jgi:hypothetical protein
MHVPSADAHGQHVPLEDYVNRLYAVAVCLGSDCLGTVGVQAGLAALRDLERGLREDLLPHMDAIEEAVCPTLERIIDDRQGSLAMRHEHEETRRLLARLGAIVDSVEGHPDRGTVLALRRLMMRMHVLLRAHLDEEELYLPVLEGRMTPERETALARTLGHIAAARL